MSAATPLLVEDVPRWILLPLEARLRGFRSPLAFSRWCQRHQVPVRPDGRKRWVCRADVDRAVAGLPPAHAPTVPPNERAAVDDAVNALVQGR